MVFRRIQVDVIPLVADGRLTEERVRKCRPRKRAFPEAEVMALVPAVVSTPSASSASDAGQISAPLVKGVPTQRIRLRTTLT